MRHRHLAAFVTVVVTRSAGVGTRRRRAESESGGRGSNVGRCLAPQPGTPDMQGYWTTQTFTPLERPERFADQEFLSAEEAAPPAAAAHGRGRRPPCGAIAIEIEDPEGPGAGRSTRRTATGSYVHYDNQIWLRTAGPEGAVDAAHVADSPIRRTAGSRR